MTGRIDAHQYIPKSPGLTADNLAQPAQHPEKLDKSGNGLLGWAEVAETYKELCIPFAQQKLKSAIKDLHQNPDGPLSFGEFFQAFERGPTSTRSTHWRTTSGSTRH
jgi:hypothetical protein